MKTLLIILTASVSWANPEAAKVEAEIQNLRTELALELQKLDEIHREIEKIEDEIGRPRHIVMN